MYKPDEPGERVDTGTPSNTEALVTKALEGSREAFEEIMRLYQGQIFRMVYMRTRSRMDAEDLTQEIFLRAFSKLCALKDAGRFRAWLFGIAVNRIRDHHRKRRLRSLFFVQPQAPSEGTEIAVQNPYESVSGLAEQEFWKRMEPFLAILSPMEREVFLLRTVDELSVGDIATAVHRREGTVKAFLHRAIKKLRRQPLLLRWLKEEIP